MLNLKMLEPTKYRVPFLTQLSVTLLLLFCVLFRQMVPVESSNSKRLEAESSSLLLTPGLDSIQVSWTHVDQENIPFRSYKVAWRSEGKLRGELFFDEGYEERAPIITELESCTTYEVSVTSDDDSRTNWTDRTTTLYAELLSLHLTPGPDSIQVSWTVDDRGNVLSGSYTVAWHIDGKLRGEVFVEDHEERALNITGLIPCTTYNVSVSMTTACENGTYLEKRVTTLVKVSEVLTLSARNITARSLALSWEQPATACEITAYNITYSGNAMWGPRTEHTNSTTTIKRGDANSTTTIAIDGLKPYTDYTVTVAASTGAVEMAAGNINATTEQDVPSKPMNLTTSSETLSIITATWRKPVEINGVLGLYNISWFRKNRTVDHALVTSPMYSIAGLFPCVEYTVRVAANTEAGEGEYQEAIQMTGKAPTVPIQDSCNFNSKNGSVSLTWTKPESDCNVSSYEVLWTHANGTNVTSTVTGTVQHFTTSASAAKGRVCVAAVVGEERGDWRCCEYGDISSAKSEDNVDRKPKTRIGVTIGSVGAIVAIIAFVVVVIVTLRRRYQKHPTEVQWMGRLSSLTSSEQDYYATLLASIKANLEPLKNKRTLAAEFDRLNKVSFEGETTVSQLPTNRKKNRYNNMTPFDTNRVRLRKGGKDVSDYINASFVKSSVKDDVRFIACQGPLSNTVSDFWWMVWEQSVKTIVMLLRSDEGEKNECFQYWPEFKEELFSPFIITLQDRQIVYGLIKRDLLLKKGNEIRAIRHFQFISWPDFGVPNSENELLMLVRDVREAIEPEESSVVVHCSAGVGQTGTFIALWQLEVQAERRLPDIDIRNTVLELRRYRQMLVQKPAQYHYLHVCFIAYLEDVGMWTRPKSRAKSAKQEHRFRSLFKSTPDLSETHTRRGTPPQIRPSTMIQNVFCSLPSRKESPQPENIALIERIVPQPNLKTDAVNNGVNTPPTQIDPIPLSPASEMVTHESNEEIENNDCRKKFPIDLVIKGPNKNSQTNTHTLTGINDSIPLDFSATNEEKEQAGNSAIGNPIYYTNFTDERKALMGTQNSDTPSRADGRNGSATELHHHSTR